MNKPALKNFRSNLGANIAKADELAAQKAKSDLAAIATSPAAAAPAEAPVVATPPRGASVSGKLYKENVEGKFFQMDKALSIAFEKTFEGSATAARLNFAIALGVAAAQAFRAKNGRPIEGNVELDPNLGIRPDELSALFGDAEANKMFLQVMDWAKNQVKPA